MTGAFTEGNVHQCDNSQTENFNDIRISREKKANSIWQQVQLRKTLWVTHYRKSKFCFRLTDLHSRTMAPISIPSLKKFQFIDKHP